MQKTAIKPLFFIAIPTMGQHSFLFTQSLLGGISPSNFSMQLRFMPGLEVGRARNLLIQEAMAAGAKYLMFRDEDTIAPANLAPALVYHMEHHAGWTFCGGLYSTKSRPAEPLVYKEWGQGPFWDFKKGEMVPVLYTGMGASIIRLSDLENLPTKVYQEKSPWSGQVVDVREYFRTNSGTGEVRNGEARKQGHTEDAFFFSLLEDAGLKSYVDTNLLCGHYDVKTNVMYYPPFDGDQAKEPQAWMQEKRIVNLGAGASDKPNELQVDLQSGPNVDFVCDIRRLPDEWANSFDVAKAHHVLEHFDFAETEDVLTEWLRILKPGGHLEIAVPDLQAVAEEIANGRFDVLVQGNIYGDEGHPFWNQENYGGYDKDKTRFLKHSNDNNHHKSGFTARSLIDLLKRVGFVNIKAERHLPVWEIHVIAYKEVQDAKEEELPNNAPDDSNP